MIASALFVLAAVSVARAQTSTASLFPVGFMDDGLRGEVVGTGAGGTTYVLSATFDELDVPYTMTLVEDATHVSITAALETAGITVPINVQCAMQGGQAVCREVVGQGIDATSFTESGPVFLTGVPIGAATGSATGTTSPRITFSSSIATATGASGDGGSILPPSISVGRPTTATLAGPDETDTSLPGLSGAVSLKNGIVVLSLAIPAALAFLNTF